jgi:hypothetical protein
MAAFLAAACGGPAQPPLSVAVDGPIAPCAPAYLSAPDLGERVSAVAAGAAEAWGAAPRALEGYRIVLEQKSFDCGRAGVEADRIVGCTWQDTRLIQLLALGAACPEATAIAHEVGHALLGDSLHRDPRWRDDAFWARMLAAMRATAPPECSLDAFTELNELHDEDD